jgi:hypothetical protein
VASFPFLRACALPFDYPYHHPDAGADSAADETGLLRIDEGS